MSSFDQIIKILQAQQKFSKLSHPYDWIPKIVNTHKLVSNYKESQSLSVILNSLAKTQNFYNKQNSIDAILNQFVLSNKFQDQFARIYSQQQALGKSLSAISKLLQQQSQAKFLFTSQNLIQNYFQQAANLAAIENDSKELEIVEEINSATANIIAGVEEKSYVSTEDLQRFQTGVLDIIEKHIEEKLKSEKHRGITAKNWDLLKGQLISFFISLFFWLCPSPTANQSITKEDLTLSQVEMFKHVNSILSQGKFIKLVKKNFRLREFPRFSSTRLLLLKKGVKVQVLNSNQSWAFVTIIDKDGYPINGWMPKSYLTK